MPIERSGLELMNAGQIYEMPEDFNFMSGRGYYRWHFRVVNPGRRHSPGSSPWMEVISSMRNASFSPYRRRAEGIFRSRFPGGMIFH